MGIGEGFNDPTFFVLGPNKEREVEYDNESSRLTSAKSAAGPAVIWAHSIILESSVTLKRLLDS